VKNEENLKDPIKYTTKLLQLKEEIDDMIAKAFNNDIRFQKNRDQSFQDFMNKQDKTPHFIAFYCDNEFKKGFKSLADHEIEVKLGAIVRLFCCLHGRDQFISSYSNLLAQRLLNKSTVSDQAEESMINKLQVECGHNTVNKIKTMFEDMRKSQQVMKDYKEEKKNQGQTIEFSTEILTSGHWPYQAAIECKIPPPMERAKQTFFQFYQNRFANRTLTWLLGHGNVQI